MFHNAMILRTEILKHIIAFRSKINQYLISVLVIGFTTLVCSPLSNTPGYYIVSLILLFVVSTLATFLRIGPVLLASSLSALVWNFFFIPPHFTFHIEKADDILMFFMFFIIALLNGILTTRIKHQEQLAHVREERTNALFHLTRELSKASGIDEVLASAIDIIKTHFSLDTSFILQDGDNLLKRSKRLPQQIKMSDEEYEIAIWSFNNKRKAGKQTSNFSNTTHTFIHYWEFV